MIEKKEIKELLERDYNRAKFEIANLETKKNIMLDDYDIKVTPSYSSGPSGKGGTSDKVFDSVCKHNNDLEKIDKQINNRKSFISLVDTLVDTLDYKEQVIVKEHAFKHKDFYTISKALKNDYDIDIYNNVYCSRVYRKSIDKLEDFVKVNNIDFKTF